MIEILQDSHTWLLISFIVFLFLLWNKGRGAFLGLIDKRIESIRQEIRVAENLRIEAQELLAQYQRKHRDAVKEAAKIKVAAEKQAAEIMRKAERELNELMERRERQLRERLERMEQNAVAEIQRYAAELAIQATTEIIGSKLDKAANDKLVDQAIEDVAKNLH